MHYKITIFGAHNPPLQCPHAISAIIAGAYSYFGVSSFNCEGENSCHDFILNPPNFNIRGEFIEIIYKFLSAHA